MRKQMPNIFRRNRARLRSRRAWLELAIISAAAMLIVTGAAVIARSSQTSPTPDGHGVASAAAPTVTSETTLASPETLTKSDRLALEEQAVASARANPSPKSKADDPGRPILTPLASPLAPEIGILEDQQSPVPPTQFLARNHWQAPVEGGATWLQVYAGITRNPADGSTGQGALMLYTMTADANGAYQVSYLATAPAPTDSGALTIVSVTDDVMQLRTDGGEVLAFDLRARQFQSPAAAP